MSNRSGWKVELIGTSVIVAMLVVVMGVSYLVGEKSCSSRAEVMDTDYRYGPFIGCVYKIDGKWIPSRNYRAGDDE